jgi:hypothetical protein
MMSLKNTVTLDEAIAYLNDLLQCDQRAITELAITRVSCNDLLRDHETAQIHVDGNQQNFIGLLGVINGLFGVDENGFGSIAAIVSPKKKLVLGFERMSAQRGAN